MPSMRFYASIASVTALGRCLMESAYVKGSVDYKKPEKRRAIMNATMNSPHQILIFILGEGGETLLDRKYEIVDGEAPEGLTEAANEMIHSITKATKLDF